MLNRELPPPPTQNVSEIRDLADRLMFTFLQRAYPKGTLISYEQVLVTWERRKRGRISRNLSTRPDFYVSKPNGREIFIECTTSRVKPEKKKDPKKWQKRIVRNGEPDKRYVVLYRHNLEAIQRHHPDLPFFKDGKANKSNGIFSAERT